MYCVFTLAGDELPALGLHHFYPGPGYSLRVVDTRPRVFHLRGILHDHLGYDLCSVSNVLAFVSINGLLQTDCIVSLILSSF
jgi:hypothetical protein